MSDPDDSCIRCLRPGTFLTPAGVCADTGACEAVQPPLVSLASEPDVHLTLAPAPPEAP